MKKPYCISIPDMDKAQEFATWLIQENRRFNFKPPKKGSSSYFERYEFWIKEKNMEPVREFLDAMFYNPPPF